MHQPAQKEQFSVAYVHAVASVAGFNLAHWAVDNDSVDVQLKAPGRIAGVRYMEIGLQLKCTQTLTGNGDHWAYQLSRKNYDDVRALDVHTPKLLVVLRVPPDLDEWLIPNDDHVILRHRAYWLSLRGHDALPEGQQSVTVHIPRQNLFDVPTLYRLTEGLAQGVL